MAQEDGKTPVQQVVQEGGAAAGAPAAGTQPAADNAAPAPGETVVVDPLDAEIAANEKAITEENARLAAAGSAAPAGSPAAAPASAAPAAGAPASAPASQPAAGEQKPGQQVPLAVALRFRDEAQRWKEQALINKGAAEAAAALARPADGAQPQGQPAAPQKTPEEQIAEKRAEKKKNGDLFDAGKITAAEMVSRNDALDDAIFEIRAAGLRAPAQQPVMLDSTVEKHAEDIVVKHPVLNYLNEQQIQNLTADAYERAQLEGKPFGKGALETMRLREMVGDLATERYAKFYVKGQPASGGGALPAAGGQPSSTSGGQPAGQGGLSDAARARDAKLDLQNRMPPDTRAVGSPDAGTQPGDAEILASLSGLSEDEQIRRLDAMPGVVQRLTGLTKL